MYENHYGFSEKPFQIVPNPKFLYLSSKHQNALTYLEYGLAEGVGFILLTGEIGSGKTTLIRHIINEIAADMDVGVIFNTNVSSDQLLNLILSEFELESGLSDKALALDRINRFLIEKFSQNRRVLLIIDEAQNLSDEALEEVRMLSNLQNDQEALLQIMIVGQPELKERLKQPSLKQFSQRVSVSYHISALSREETEKYIVFRLDRVGGNTDLFTDAAVAEIYRFSQGIPRSINLLCDAALVYGFADELQVIDTPVIEQVISDRDGVGGEMAGEAVQMPSAIVAEDTGEQILYRLSVLESGMQKLQVQMDWQVGELEKQVGDFRDQIVANTKQLYLQERKRNNNIRAAYYRLKGKYENFRETIEGQEPSAKPEVNQDEEEDRADNKDKPYLRRLLRF